MVERSILLRVEVRWCGGGEPACIRLRRSRLRYIFALTPRARQAGGIPPRGPDQAGGEEARGGGVTSRRGEEGKHGHLLRGQEAELEDFRFAIREAASRCVDRRMYGFYLWLIRQRTFGIPEFGRLGQLDDAGYHEMEFK